MVNEQNKKEQSNVESSISPAQVMDKIQQAIESDKDLSAGHFIQFQETTRADNPSCIVRIFIFSCNQSKATDTAHQPEVYDG